MLANLLASIRSLGLHGYEVAGKIGMDEVSFSRALNGRRQFTPVQKERLSEITRVPSEVLFSSAPPGSAKSGSSLPELFREIETTWLGGGDPCFILERILRRESREIYYAVCAHLLSWLRVVQKIPATTKAVHFSCYFDPTAPWPQPFEIHPGPPKRANEDTIQTAESPFLHPIGGTSDVSPVRENTMLKMNHVERR